MDNLEERLDVTGIRMGGEVAEVSDKAMADALPALPAELGVRAVGGRPAKDQA